jgi:hypothetical protein
MNKPKGFKNMMKEEKGLKTLWRKKRVSKTMKIENA